MGTRGRDDRRGPHYDASMRLAPALLGIALVGCSSREPASPSLTVDLGERHQTIVGFGGFGPAKVWWADPPYFDDAYLDRVVDELGASIFRTAVYWDFEPENDDGDPRTLDRSRLRYGPDSDNGKQFPFLRALRARGVHTILASVWTPPLWMKLDPDDGLAPFCHGQCGGRLNPAMREEYAEYLAAYVAIVQEQTGIELYGLSIQNEPLFANPFESCVYTPSELARTLQTVGARFRREGRTTQLFGPEHMGSFERNEREGLFGALLDDPAVARYLDAYAVHGYLDGVSPDHGSAEGWARMRARVAAANKPLWMTETSGEVGSYDQAFAMTEAIHYALADGDVEAWVYWYLAKAVLDEGEPTVLFHLLRTYFKYVRPGAIRVGAHASDPHLLVTAFSRGGALTVVVINEADESKTAALTIRGRGAPTALRRYRTSAREPFVPLGPVDLERLDFPARSITTLVAGDPFAP